MISQFILANVLQQFFEAFGWQYCYKCWTLCGLVAVFQKVPFSFMRRFYCYCCLLLVRTHFCFIFENVLSYDNRKGRMLS